MARLLRWLCCFAFVFLPFAAALTGAACMGQAPRNTVFQTDKPWSPRVNVEAGTVMVYGIDETMPARIASWREHGYHVAVMTGVAWGRYGDYLRGDFDGKEHWNETQEEKSGKLILHSGREVPYISPSESYGKYLSKGVARALDAGAEAIYLEEPEFWARAGWSDSFKASWQEFYREPWQAPDSSPDAQYRASKLKYALYRHALEQVFAYVKQWGGEHGRQVPCYVATHSLINYAQWSIVSPESSLLQVGADGYIAQVWTGTAREPNVFEGVKAERTFETAFLEYGALQNIARSSGKTIWYLNDPIEDNPRHSWADYQRNWESTLTASLLQPEVSHYEILPWPDRIFGAKSVRPSAEPTAANPAPEKVPVSPAYRAELQTVFHALGQMPGTKATWETAGTEGVGVLVSDTMMFQRAVPEPSDAELGSFYGLALPLLMRGVPVEPVQIESTYGKGSSTAFLNHYRVLLLTYEGQKPPSPAFDDAMAAWVRRGGALVVVDDDTDPYLRARDWWNTPPHASATPRIDLFRSLGVDPRVQKLSRVGKGTVLYAAQSPAALSHRADGGAVVRSLVTEAAASVHLPWQETPALVLRRGPFVIAAGLQGASSPVVLKGRYLDLFDPEQAVLETVTLAPGTHVVLLDLAAMPRAPAVLAAGAKIDAVRLGEGEFSFAESGMNADPQGGRAVITARLPRAPKGVLCDGAAVPDAALQYADGVLRLTVPSDERVRQVVIQY